MKNLITSLAFATLAFTTLNQAAHASVITDGITLSVNGSAIVGIYNPVLHDYTFTDTITNVGPSHHGDFSETVSTITGTYTDVSGVLGSLAITDVCNVSSVAGTTTPACSNVTLVATDSGLGNVTGITGPAGSTIGPLGLSAGTLTLLGSDINLQSTGHDRSTFFSTGSASGDITFAPAPDNSPVPEPGSLSLMATGLVAAAGAIRRKFLA
jgi:hypothetical protein